MRKVAILAACVFALAIIASPTLAGEDCSCKEIKKAGYGFCESCKSGTLFGVKLTSAKLYDALSGHKIDTSELKCGGCKTAAKENGSCCGMSMANGKAYHAKASYTLALGKEFNSDKMKCGGCKTADYKSGVCKGCDVGMVAHRVFKSGKPYEEAKAAYSLITEASKVSAHCDDCAVAMVKDGSCKACKVSFKDGKKV